MRLFIAKGNLDIVSKEQFQSVNGIFWVIDLIIAEIKLPRSKPLWSAKTVRPSVLHSMLHYDVFFDCFSIFLSPDDIDFLGVIYMYIYIHTYIDQLISIELLNSR